MFEGKWNWDALSLTTAACVLVSSVALGLLTPRAQHLASDFHIESNAYDWPHTSFARFEWHLTIPVGLVVVVMVFSKDALFPARAGYWINLATILGTAVLWLVWIWAMVPHRMV
jgi:hypothetical protein